MKVSVAILALFALLLLFVPMLALGQRPPAAMPEGIAVHAPAPPSSAAPEQPLPSASSSPQEAAEMPTGTSNLEGLRFFKILNTSTGKVEEVSVQDYIRGAVAAEMPASFHSEALKAQAVAAHTYALHNHLLQQKSPDPALKGADFEADPLNMKVYITEKKAKEFYGDSFDLYWTKICEAADSVASYVLEYEGDPIVAAYHAISAGQTEAASNVWSGSAPYLMPAVSSGDVLAPNYHTTTSFSQEETKRILSQSFAGFDASAPPDSWFDEIERSDSGYITSVTIGENRFHGKDIRAAFDLRSHNIDISFVNGNFVFDVFGYGHGVGLSQYGADFLARQGYTFDEILDTYYTDTVLTQLKSA